MPPHSNLQLLKLHYREFLRKTAANHRSDGGDACTHNYYVERACVEATFDNSFAKLAQIVTTVKFSELRASYHARKERAKERLRRAFVSRLGSYLGSASGSGPVLPDANSAQLLGLSSDELSVALPRTHEATADPRIMASSSSPDLETLYGTDGFLRRTLLYLLGHAARTYMMTLNTTRVEGLDAMAAALQRPAGQALITVSNHVAALDDPLVVSALLPEGALERPESVRWTLCATDRCFRYAALVPLFRAAKVLPVVRGGGLAQPGMAAAEARLASGDWVHIFPEGTRSPDGVTLGAVRKGVGSLVASLPAGAPPPLVLPFVHRGMEDVMPRGAAMPAVGQQVDVLVGEPIPVADLLSAARAEKWPADRLHTAVAARVAHGLQDLRRRLDARRDGLPDPGPIGEGGGAAAAGGRGGGETDVSSLDQFDPADVALAAQVRRQGGASAMSATWERFKSRAALQHHSWATQGVSVATAQQAPGMANVAGATVADRLGGCSAAQLGGSSSGAVMAGVSPYMRQLLGMAQRARASGMAEGGVEACMP